MHHDKLRPQFLLGMAALILFFLVFSSCQGDLPTTPNNQIFTKVKLEKLGAMLRQELLAQHEVLPMSAPYDTSVYFYLQSLYNQATSSIHLDKQSPNNNKWDQARQWQVFVLKNDTECLAYTLPGGDFFITTGMLKRFKKDYEVYALMSFEATLMNDGFLMEKWIQEYNTLTINNLIEGNDQPDPLTASELSQAMTSFSFEPRIVEFVDKASIENTCNTSILDPVGLQPYLSNAATSDTEWLKTRPSYDGRTHRLPKIASETCINNQLGNVNFQRFVLNVLD